MGIKMTILVNKRPKNAIPITELRAVSSIYSFRRKYLKLNPEVSPLNVVIYRYGRRDYPVYELWEILGNGNQRDISSSI